MQVFYKIVSIFFVFYFLLSCSSNDKDTISNLPSNFEIDGQVLGAANQPIFLEMVSSKGKIKLAESITEVDGSFELKGHVKGLGLYQLTIGNKSNKSVPLTISPNEHVNVKANYNEFERLPIITGTKWAPLITEYMRVFNDFAFKQIQLMNTPGLSEEEQLNQFFELKKPLDEYAISTLKKYPSNPAVIVLSTTLTPAMGFEKWDSSYLEILKSVSKAFVSKYSTSPVAQSFRKQVLQIERAYNEFKMQATQPSGLVGSMMTDIALPNPDGKIIRLSDLKGNVILLDFWASWCGPCRAENPNVVNLYKKYSSKGFTVFSVSLDSDIQAWKRAIKSDGLVWLNHVSDLKQWQTPIVKQYQFDAIPYTVLIDRTGKIVATNLRGSDLELKISTLLK